MFVRERDTETETERERRQRPSIIYYAFNNTHTLTHIFK